jgi:PEP-CTERM motif
MKLRVAASSALAGALALTGVLAIPGSAEAASVAINLNVYDTGAVDSTPGQILGIVTIQDLSGGGVSVDFPLSSPATLFASTGGGHITAGFKLDTSITAADVTVTTPAPPTFMFATPVNGVPGPSGGFGNFTAGLQGSWNGTSNIFAGPIDFTIAGISVSDFVANSKGFFAVADLLGPNGTGEVGGMIETTITQHSAVPEPSTWAMLLIGFAGLGFAGYRKAKTTRTAFTAA